MEFVVVEKISEYQSFHLIPKQVAQNGEQVNNTQLELCPSRGLLELCPSRDLLELCPSRELLDYSPVLQLTKSLSQTAVQQCDSNFL